MGESLAHQPLAYFECRAVTHFHCRNFKVIRVTPRFTWIIIPWHLYISKLFRGVTKAGEVHVPLAGFVM